MHGNKFKHSRTMPDICEYSTELQRPEKTRSAHVMEQYAYIPKTRKEELINGEQARTGVDFLHHKYKDSGGPVVFTLRGRLINAAAAQ